MVFGGISFFQAASTVVLLLLIRFVFKVIYRLTLHPLASFPGPKVTAATYLYEWYYDLLYGDGSNGGQYYAKIDLLHEQYGPIIRVTPEEVHIKDSSYFSTIYSSAPTKRDKHHMIALIGGDLKSVFASQEHETHRIRKAATAPLFSKRSINDSQDVIWGHVKLLWSKLDNMPGPYELHQQLLAATTDIVGDFAMGRTLGFQNNPKSAEEWKTTVYTLAEMTPLVRKIPWAISLSMSLPQWLSSIIAPKFAIITGLYLQARVQAETYLAQNTFDTSSRNVYEQIRASSLPEWEKTLRRHGDEAVSFVLAGSETTATVTTAAIFHVLKDKKTLAKLREEITEPYRQANEQPTLATLQSLPYLNAVIRESMRITSVFMSRSTVLAHEELNYHGWKIPPMTAVSMNFRDVLHDPKIWPEPLKFVPERWIVDGKRNTELDKHWVVFSRGHRMCAGLELGLAELFMLTSSLLRRYDLELYDTEWERDVELTRDCFIGMPRPGSRGVRVVNKGQLA